MLDQGGTLDVFLANHALQRGYKATILTYNLDLFDPDLVRAAERRDPRAARGQAKVKRVAAPAGRDARL